MDHSRNTEATGEVGQDLSALAWVQEELRRSLDAAHKALRRFVKEAEALAGSDVDVVDPSVLRTARQQIHQGVGALELVGLPAAATVLRACEAAVQRYVAKPHKLTHAIVDDLEHASFALLDYVARMLAGRPVPPLAMFPQYRKVQEDAGAERVHPADLWATDWRWRDLPDTGEVVPAQPDAAMRTALEQQMLAMMRGPTPAACARMSDLCASLGAGATQPTSATMWKLAAAVFEAQGAGLLPADVFVKRVASRLLAQLRIVERGEGDVSERLAQDLLFFCAQAAAPGRAAAPRLASVREAYRLQSHQPVDYATSHLGQYDPAWVAQARKRVAAAKESWSAVAGGEMHRVSGLAEQFSLVGDSLRRLFPQGESMATELQHAVALTQQSQAAPGTTLAMEVATGLLYLEAALEDADFDTPEQGQRVARLAHRIHAMRRGAAPEPLEGWMEELYRRVSDRQTMGSVVQELRASLCEAEKLIDQFFRNPADRNVLIPVPNQLSAMRGVLSVLGMEQASTALVRMRDDVDGLVQTELRAERAAEPGIFDRLAGNLGALGFLIDMLSVQPQLAKSLFVYDAQAGTLNPLMGRAAPQVPTPHTMPAAAPVEPRLIEQAQQLAFSAARGDVPVEDVARGLEQLSHELHAADQPALVAAVSQAQEALEQAHGDADQIVSLRGELSEALVDFVSTASGNLAAAEGAPAAPLAAPAPAPAPATVDLAEDDEMREIFLEEAREVVENAGAACRELADTPTDVAQMTAVRRAFHTLKGSSRMVGLQAYGDAAWACEQLYNTRLADHLPADPALLQFTGWALGYFGAWVDEIAERRDGGRDPRVMQDAVQSLRAPGAFVPPASLATAPACLPAVEVIEAPQGVGDLAPALPEVVESMEPVDAAGFEAAAPVAAESAQAGPAFPFDLDLDLDPSPAGVPLPTAEATAFEPLPAFEPTPAAGASALDLPALHLDPTAFEGAPTEPAPLSFELAVPEAVEVGEAIELVDLDLGGEPDAPAIEALAPAPATAAVEPAEVAEPQPLEAPAEDEQVRIVGPLRISIPLFNIFLNEADELSRRLTTELAEWAMELHRPVGEMPIALAHSLAGSSATVGFADLSQLARTLEHALMRTETIGRGTRDEAQLFVETAEEIRRLLHQFAAGFLKEPRPALLEQLNDHELTSARRLEAVRAEQSRAEASDEDGQTAEAAQAGAAIESLDPQDVPAVLRAKVVAAGPVAVEPVAAEPVAVEPVAAEPVAAEAVAVEPVAAEPPAEPLAVEPVAAEPVAAKPVAVGPVAAEPVAPAPLGAATFKPFTERRADAAVPVQASREPAGDDDIDAVDAVDAELFPIFEEEGQELLPKFESQLRDWSRHPADTSHASACMRTLHTLKGGARLAGAMRLGEMAHRLETAIEELLRQESPSADDIEALHNRSDALSQTFEALRSRDAAAYAAAVAHTEAAANAPQAVAIATAAEAPAQAEPPSAAELPAESATPAVAPSDAATGAPAAGVSASPAEEPAAAPPVERAAPAEAAEPLPAAAPAPLAPVSLPEIDWSRFTGRTVAPRVAPADRAAASQSAVRVRAPLLDRLVNHAGEVSIARSRIEAEVVQIKGSLGDLTDNLERLRQQLRDIELQAETQMSSRLEAAKAAAQSFDPLEFDRFTRFQELTRMMAESVNDVATVQRTLQRALESCEDELAAQARLTRELQDDLLRTRMVEFDGLSDRLYRVVRQAAKETGKQVRLDIVGGSIEVDRGVLDRMTGSFEHLLRNAVSHGIESPEERTAAGKGAAGSVTVSLSHEGNEVGVEFRDDGAGLDLGRIREKGLALGMLEADQSYGDAELANLIFHPGFSTADRVTELAGRGVGMDVVRSEVNAMGGRIETATARGQGTSFRLVLPLTTAVTQVVMLRVGEATVAVPSTLVEIVRRAKADEIEAAYRSGTFAVGDRTLPFFWLGSLLQLGPRSKEAAARTRQVVIIRSAQQRIAIHIDEVLGNQEVVVKNLGPQLSRMPGLAGMTLLASGAVALIYNPVALATLYGVEARAATVASLEVPHSEVETPLAAVERARAQAPLVMVVDDSLTVRRVTQRLLVREGYRVTLAKDGLDALERLAQERPAIVLSDIEMPRMDGFDLVRNMRSDARLRDLPVIMITSRIAQKHRDYAAELGVDHYLGKPYSEEDLLALIGRYTAMAEAG